MRTLSFAGLGFMTALIMPVAASAAEMAVKTPSPATTTPTTFNWTGWYVGVNGGGAWGSQDPFNIITDRFDALSTSISGGLAGGTIGAQAQAGNVLVGVEADIDWAHITGSTTATPTVGGAPLVPVTASTMIDTQSTLRVRAGVPLNYWLPYLTAGVALLDAKTDLTTPAGAVCGGDIFKTCSGANHQIGAALGGGVEYAFTDHWSVKLEYLYVTAASLDISHDNEIRAGVNYRFTGM
jgi:outer membrane immunogenic protein